MSRWIALAAAGLLALAQPAFAAPTADESQDTTVEGLVITAPPRPADKDVIAAFVEDVSQETVSGRLGRWDRQICPAVLGIKPVYAQAMIARIVSAGRTVGLRPGKKGCRPNMVVVVTDDSDTLVRELVARHPRLFAKRDRAISRGKAAMDGFVASDAPVRWWHVMGRIDAWGMPLRPDGTQPGKDSRILSATREDFDRVIIVVDVERMHGVPLGTLSDYVAMVSLAQIRPDAHPIGGRSILNLFSDMDAGLAPVTGLTSWDRAYLKALYAAQRDLLQGSRQKWDIVRSMMSEPPSPEPEEPEPE